MNLWPWVRRSEYEQVAAQLKQLRLLSKYWYEECERADVAYKRLELRLISVRGELQYERERRIREKVVGLTCE